MVRREIDKKSKRHHVQIMYGLTLGQELEKPLKEEKQAWAIEKPKLEYAKQLRGIYSIDPNDEDSKDIIKNARRKLEKPKAAAMPCKRATPKACRRETAATKQGKAKASEAKTKFDCIAEGHESTRQRIESATKKDSPRSHCRKRAKFRIALQFGA